ncbi:ABC transporter substrate-binding protein [Rhodoplanes roseus]|nr:ABC transporter substrate-binding protein [Rhodoplanes roseus]
MSDHPRLVSRRDVLRTSAAAASAATIGTATGFVAPAAADPVKIRYATGGGIGPNEMETIVFLDHLKQNVLKNYGKAYTLDMTFTRGTPEAATLLASGQVDLATLSFSAFATMIAKNALPGGMTIVSDNYQDGHPGNATNTFFVPNDSPIKSVADLKGKKVGINAFGSAVDLVLRVVLKKNGLDPRRDVQIVEVSFPNMAPAIREKRVDCGVLVIPFLPTEAAKGDLRPLFTGGDAFGPSSVIFQVASNAFLKSNQAAVKAFLADYVDGLAWYYDPANRAKAIELIADFTKSPKPVLESYFATPRDYYRDIKGCVPAAAIQKPIDAMLEEKLIDQRVDVSKYLDLSLLPFPCAT